MIAVDSSTISAVASVCAVVLVVIGWIGKQIADRLDKIEAGQLSATHDVFSAINELRDDQAATRENVAYIAGRNNLDLPRKIAR